MQLRDRGGRKEKQKVVIVKMEEGKLVVGEVVWNRSESGDLEAAEGIQKELVELGLLGGKRLEIRAVCMYFGRISRPRQARRNSERKEESQERKALFFCFFLLPSLLFCFTRKWRRRKVEEKKVG